MARAGRTRPKALAGAAGATGDPPGGRPCRRPDRPRTAARVTGEAPDDPWHPERIRPRTSDTHRSSCESQERAPRRRGCHGRSARRLARAGVRTGVEQRHGSSGEAPADPWHPERIRPRTSDTHRSSCESQERAPRRRGCHGRAARRLARAGVRTAVEQPHGSSGEAPDDPWHPERIRPRTSDTHRSSCESQERAPRRRGCHGRSARRSPVPASGPASNSRTGHGRSAR